MLFMEIKIVEFVEIVEIENIVDGIYDNLVKFLLFVVNESEKCRKVCEMVVYDFELW